MFLKTPSPGRPGVPAGQVRRSHCSVAEKAKRDAVRCSRRRIRPRAARRFWRKPPVRYVASMSRNRLTKPSNSSRTYQEHRKVGRRWVRGRLLGNVASQNMMLCWKNARGKGPPTEQCSSMRALGRTAALHPEPDIARQPKPLEASRVSSPKSAKSTDSLLEGTRFELFSRCRSSGLPQGGSGGP